MPGPLGKEKKGQSKLPKGGDSDADKGLSYVEKKVQERVQPVVLALREMKPVFQENTKAIQELTRTLQERR